MHCLSTQNTLIKLQGADIGFILVVGAAKSCRFRYLNETMTIISFNKKSSFQVGFECYMAVRRHLSYIAEPKKTKHENPQTTKHIHKFA